MIKRSVLFVLLVAAVLVVAAPALAFDGSYSTYANSTVCQGCHDTGSTIAPVVYPQWSLTAHAAVGDPATFTANALPIAEGPGCAGCHSGAYDPTKAQGTQTDPGPPPVITYPYQNTAGDDAFAEPFDGCSACHVNNLTGHATPFAELANPDVCGACHTRYATNKTSYALLAPTNLTSPYAPEYAVAFNPFSVSLPSGQDTPAAGQTIANVLSIPTPASPQRNAFWSGGQSAKAHGEGAVQYEEFMQDKYTGTGDITPAHINSLDSLKALAAQVPGVVTEECLKCHSTDYMLAVQHNAQPGASQKPVPTLADATFGVTCQACHDPHTLGTSTANWNADHNPQLVAPKRTLCTKCHDWSAIPANGELQPGAEVHYPQKQMMDGDGAIGVAHLPSVHKGDCVDCHMVPTGYEYNGAAGTAGNHIFKIVTPDEAAGQTTNTATGPQHMPWSSCSTCHGRANDPLATRMQGVLDNTQEMVTDKLAAIQTALDTAAFKMGYVKLDGGKYVGDAAAAKKAIMAKSSKTSAQLAFLDAGTNADFVTADASKGIHNRNYTFATLSAALSQARQAQSVPWVAYKVTLKASKTSVSAGTTVKLTGAVSPVDWTTSLKVTIQRKTSSGWKTFKAVAVSAGKYSYSFKTSKGTYTLRSVFSSSTGRPKGTSATVTVKAK